MPHAEFPMRLALKNVRATAAGLPEVCTSTDVQSSVPDGCAGDVPDVPMLRKAPGYLS